MSTRRPKIDAPSRMRIARVTRYGSVVVAITLFGTTSALAQGQPKAPPTPRVHTAPQKPPATPEAAPGATPGAAPVIKPRNGVPILGPGGAPAGATSQPAASQPAASQPAASQPTMAGATSQPAASQPTSLPAWVPKLRATVKPAVAHIGDPIHVTLTTTYKKGISVTLPLKLDLGDFTELARNERVREGGPAGHIPTVEHIFDLDLGAYKLGDLDLPPIEINALGPGGNLVSLKTQALRIRIKSVMANEPTPKLKKIAKTVRVFEKTWWLLYLLLAIGLIGLTVVITLIIRRRLEARRRAERPAPPPPPPHDVALRRLAALDVDAFIAEERFKELYLELSEIVREYIGGRFGFDALEMTTTEINETLETRTVALALRQRLSTYFNDCDLVKFARFRPDEDSARGDVGEAERLVRDTTAAWGLPPREAAPKDTAPTSSAVEEPAVEEPSAATEPPKDSDGGTP